jgi:hypothetical protein
MQQLDYNNENRVFLRGPCREVILKTNGATQSEKILHKDYYRKSSAEKSMSGRGSQGTWRQDELIGGKPPVIINTDSDSVYMKLA